MLLLLELGAAVEMVVDVGANKGGSGRGGGGVSGFCSAPQATVRAAGPARRRVLLRITHSPDSHNALAPAAAIAVRRDLRSFCGAAGGLCLGISRPVAVARLAALHSASF